MLDQIFKLNSRQVWSKLFLETCQMNISRANFFQVKTSRKRTLTLKAINSSWGGFLGFFLVLCFAGEVLAAGSVDPELGAAQGFGCWMGGGGAAFFLRLFPKVDVFWTGLEVVEVAVVEEEVVGGAISICQNKFNKFLVSKSYFSVANYYLHWYFLSNQFFRITQKIGKVSNTGHNPKSLKVLKKENFKKFFSKKLF